MNKAYSRINWENDPSKQTPLNESNLNKMDNALNTIDDRVVEMDSTTVKSNDISNNIKSFSVGNDNVITVTKYSGETETFSQVSDLSEDLSNLGLTVDVQGNVIDTWESEV